MYLGDKWWAKAIVYEVYVDKFAGNFVRMTSKLDYLHDLGINTIWLLPHYPSPMIDGGYDISDYYGVRKDLGTIDEFENFVREAHNHSLKIITDLVLNHTSITHPWFKEKKDWYLWDKDQKKYSQAFVHFADIKKGNNWIKDDDSGEYYYATFYPQQPDLNWDNPAVMSEMLNVINYWVSKGVDGFRLDAVSRLAKRDNTNCFALPETHELLKQIRSHIDSLNPEIVLMAEAGGWPNEAYSFFGNSDECQMVINFPMAIRMLATIKDHNLTALMDLWKQTPPAPVNCLWSLFLTNHDSNDVFFLQNDKEKKEILERIKTSSDYSYAMGQSVSSRLNDMCFGKEDEIIWATKLLLDQPGVPIIYYGNEIGMHNERFTTPPSDSRDYVRGLFDWNEADRQKENSNSIFNQVRSLIVQRNESFIQI